MITHNLFEPIYNLLYITEVSEELIDVIASIILMSSMFILGHFGYY